MNGKIFKKLATQTSKIIRAMAMLGANSASIYCLGQPVEPKEMEKFKKNLKK